MRRAPGGRGAFGAPRAGGVRAADRGMRASYWAASSFTTWSASVIVRPQATPCIWSG